MIEFSATTVDEFGTKLMAMSEVTDKGISSQALLWCALLYLSERYLISLIRRIFGTLQVNSLPASQPYHYS